MPKEGALQMHYLLISLVNLNKHMQNDIRAAHI